MVRNFRLLKLGKMFLKLFILSIFLAALALVGLGIRLLAGKDNEVRDQSCSLEENGSLAECTGCTIRDLINCDRQRSIKYSRMYKKSYKTG